MTPGGDLRLWRWRPRHGGEGVRYRLLHEGGSVWRSQGAGVGALHAADLRRAAAYVPAKEVTP